MIVLGIETATQICGVALTQEGRLLCEYRSLLKNAHARVLTTAIENLLHDAQLKPAQIDGIAISIGPGSFTGLRIGLATAKGMAYALGCALVAVPTLAALAYQAPLHAGVICPLIRSRAGHVYAALYRRSPDHLLHLIQEARILATEELPAFLPKGSLVIGQVDELPLAALQQKGCPIAADDDSLLSAYTIAKLGSERLQRGLIESIVSVEPHYLQEFIVGKPKRYVRPEARG